MSERQSDPILKALARRGYGLALGALTAANALLPRRPGLAVFYGGARAGNVGGPLVKVQRLRGRFPERRWRYSTVYSLSNAPYLPPLALRLLKMRGVPLVHNQNGVFYGAWYDGDWRAQNAVMARAYHAADYVFWQSAFCRETADRFLGRRQGPGEILFNAVDLGLFSPAPVRLERPFTFLLTGKIGAHLLYRLESTISGLAAVRRAGAEAVLEIAGWVAPEAEARARALAEDEGVAGAVRFTGRYTQQQAPDIYRGADAYVMTKHNDPCPNTVLEAMACGLPVVYSASGGVPELVGPKAGVGLDVPDSFEHVHAPTAEAVAVGMRAVMDGHVPMASAARRRAEACFDMDAWLDRHEQVFTALLEGRRP